MVVLCVAQSLTAFQVPRLEKNDDLICLHKSELWSVLCSLVINVKVYTIHLSILEFKKLKSTT